MELCKSVIRHLYSEIRQYFANSVYVLFALHVVNISCHQAPRGKTDEKTTSLKDETKKTECYWRRQEEAKKRLNVIGGDRKRRK